MNVDFRRFLLLFGFAILLVLGFRRPEPLSDPPDEAQMETAYARE